MTPRVWAGRPSSSVKLMRWTVNDGSSSVTSTPSRCQPLEGVGRRVVPAGAVGLVGQVDHHGVLGRAGDQRGPVVGVDDVVGRAGHVLGPPPGGEADAAERLEAGHGPVLSERSR